MLKHWDKLASYTYSMTAYSPTLLIHTDYATLPTQCGKTDKDDQYTQTHTDPTVHVMWQSTCTVTSMVSCLFLVHWWALCSNKLTTFNLEVRMFGHCGAICFWYYSENALVWTAHGGQSTAPYQPSSTTRRIKDMPAHHVRLTLCILYTETALPAGGDNIFSHKVGSEQKTY